MRNGDVRQGCTQQPCTFPLVCRFPRVTCVTRMRSASRLASPKVRCRGVVSLSWGARGRAPLRKQGGQALRARSKQHKLLKNKNKIKAEADLLEVAEPIATNRRRESAAHLGACASNKDAFVCMRIARACADKPRGWAEAARRTSRRRQPPLRQQVVYTPLLAEQHGRDGRQTLTQREHGRRV